VNVILAANNLTLIKFHIARILDRSSMVNTILTFLFGPTRLNCFNGNFFAALCRQLRRPRLPALQSATTPELHRRGVFYFLSHAGLIPQIPAAAKSDMAK